MSATIDHLRKYKRDQMAVWLQGDGIEIGALYRPLDVPHGARVRYVDRMTVADLRRHYPELAGQEFVPVSVIGDAENLANIPDSSVDFVIANHVVEHMEYPIKALCEFYRVLKRGGVLYIALPDARTGIDSDRPLTPVEHLLDEHARGAAANRRAHYHDWVANCEKHFHKRTPAQIDARTNDLIDMNYSIHFHVWTPDSFIEFLVRAQAVAAYDFELLAFSPPEFPGIEEFILVLGKGRGTTPRPSPIRQGGQAVPGESLETELSRLHSEVGELRTRVRWMESSRFWKLRGRVVHARGRLRNLVGAPRGR
jgi:SAM-dependent methyltransferase